MVLTYTNQPRAALAVLDELGEPPDPWGRAQHAIALIPSLVAVGRAETAVTVARRAFAQHQDLSRPIAIADAPMHTIHEVYATAECGRLKDAADLAEREYRSVPTEAGPDILMWLAYHQGRCALLEGAAATARRWLAEAVARSEEHHFTGPRRMALSLLATAHALLGDAADATATVAELDQLPEFAHGRAEQEMGRAWALVAAGDVPGGRGVLLAAADVARSPGHRASEAWLLHDVVRLGGVAEVGSRLDELAQECEGQLVAAYARHARAVSGGRPDRLAEAADAFAEMGANLLAAEATIEAAAAHQRRGERRAATALLVRANGLAAACVGARTPALAPPTSFVPLTTRERDIATLAARGESSKSIAERLYLSVRTVDNHLQNVYGKLGVTGRRELAQALADVPEIKPEWPRREPR
jgi:DNA-binding CsgD family transcriptional regulator